MDLGYDTEQVILREQRREIPGRALRLRAFRKIAESEAGLSREMWSEFAALGWLGLPFAPEDGGSGGGAVELAILMEAFGRHLVHRALSRDAWCWAAAWSRAWDRRPSARRSCRP